MRLNKFFATTVTICLMLLLGGVAAYLVVGADVKSKAMVGQFRVGVYVADSVIGEQVSVIENEIKKCVNVADVEVISKAKAAQEFFDLVGVKVGDKNPLPVSFRIKLNGKGDVKETVNQFKKIKGVEEVEFPFEMVANVKDNLGTIGRFAIGFCALLAFVIVVVIRNAIRLDVAASSEAVKEAVAKKLPKNFIRQPFINRAFTQGAIAGALACVFLFIVTDGIGTVYPSTQLGIDIQLMGVIFAFMLLAGMLLAWMFAFFAVNYQINQSIKN